VVRDRRGLDAKGYACTLFANAASAIEALFDELDKHVPVVCTLTELMELRHDH
jgi:hypothetical protein